MTFIQHNRMHVKRVEYTWFIT